MLVSPPKENLEVHISLAGCWFQLNNMADLGYTNVLQQKCSMIPNYEGYIYRVIHKSLRDFRTRLRNNQDRHGRKEHINR